MTNIFLDLSTSLPEENYFTNSFAFLLRNNKEILVFLLDKLLGKDAVYQEIIKSLKKERFVVAEYIDVKAFRKIEKMSFKDKITYLHKKGILQDSSYRLLDKAREVRNKIHVEPIVAGLSEQDYTLFSMASWITSQIWSAMRFDWEEEIITNIKSNTEKVAEQWLKTLQTKPQEARPSV
jgi:hypothetical protein